MKKLIILLLLVSCSTETQRTFSNVDKPFIIIGKEKTDYRGGSYKYKIREHREINKNRTFIYTFYIRSKTNRNVGDTLKF